MKFILSACAVVAVLIALGDLRYIQKVTERYSFDRTALEKSLFTQINAPNKRIHRNFQGLPVVDGLSIVPGKNSRQMGLVLEVPLHDFSGRPDPRRIITMTIDVDVAIWGRSIKLARPCLRHASHHMGPNIEQRAKDEVLRVAVNRIFEKYLFSAPAGTLVQAPTVPAPVAPAGPNIIDHPVTRVNVKGNTVQFVLGLVDEFRPDTNRWPDPVGVACASG